MACQCYGITTYSTKTIGSITKKGIFLDNGEGNDPTGPFDSNKFDLISLRGMGLGSQYLVPLKNR